MAVKEELSGFLKKYKRIVRQAKFKIKAEYWILISSVVAASVFAACFLLILFLNLKVSQLTSIAFSVGALNLMLGYPYLKSLERINLIEEALPDVLKQMADTLKAGGTYELALREVALAQYGPLSKEMELVLRKLEEGENLENSLNSFSENIDSRLVNRSVTVIIDSIKAGAGLADVLEEISEDVREIHRISIERKAQTMLQVIFMIAAGIFLTPMIFGFVSTVIEIFVKASTGIITSQAEITETNNTKELVLLLMLIYLMVETFATSVMVSLMREGKMSKSIIYFPILLLISFLLYYTTVFLSSGLVG